MSELRAMADRKLAATGYDASDLLRLGILCASWLDATENSEAEDLMEHSMLSFHDEMQCVAPLATDGRDSDGVVSLSVVSEPRLRELLAGLEPGAHGVPSTDEEDRTILGMALGYAQLRDAVIEAVLDAEKGFVACPCGRQEETEDLDFVLDLRAALKGEFRSTPYLNVFRANGHEPDFTGPRTSVERSITERKARNTPSLPAEAGE